MAGRTRKAARNVVFNVGNQVVTLVLAFVSRTVFVRTLGAGYLGVNGLFSDVLSMLTMADLGLNTAMVYSMYKPLAEGDHERMAQLTTFYGKVYRVIALAVTVIGVALIPALPRIVNLSEPMPHLWLYYLLSLSNIVVSYLCVYRTSVLSADQKGYVLSGLSTATQTTCVVLQIVVLLLTGNFALYLAVMTVTTLAHNVAGSIIAARKYPFIRRRARLPRDEQRAIFANIGSSFLYKVSTVLISSTTNIIISVLIGTVVVGYYSNYLMLQNKIVMFYSAMFSALAASIGNVVATESAAKRREVFDAEQSVSFIFCGVTVPCYVVLVNDCMRLWLGTEYTFPFPVVLAIGLSLYLSCVCQPLWSYRDATGMYQRTKWVMACCAVVNCALAVVLGLWLGVAGVILAQAVAKLATYFWFEPMVLFGEFFDASPAGYFRDVGLNAALIAALVAAGVACGGFVHVDSWGMWIAKAAVMGVVCAVVTLACYRRSRGFGTILAKVRRRG